MTYLNIAEKRQSRKGTDMVTRTDTHAYTHTNTCIPRNGTNMLTCTDTHANKHKHNKKSLSIEQLEDIRSTRLKKLAIQRRLKALNYKRLVYLKLSSVVGRLNDFKIVLKTRVGTAVTDQKVVVDARSLFAM